ncbi:MAPEG family protein [Mesorhizobium sp. CAU 1732]|uniref:MAPEG family protein n=1 Tax=Mesorhizobium sp. CAU 1732 TaxID=3140358 RepID=UPI003261106B
MNQTAIFWPMIAHVALVFGIYFLMFLRRKAAVQAGSVRISDFRENQKEPPESLFVRNNLANQFELPVLFHACCLTLYAVAGAGLLAVVLAWIFAISRYVHAYIHVTSNRMRYRQPAFSLGFIALVFMWILLAVHLLTA